MSIEIKEAGCGRDELWGEGTEVTLHSRAPGRLDKSDDHFSEEDVGLTAKEYLQQAYRLEQRRRAKWAQIEALASIAEHSTSCLTAIRVGGTNQRSKIEFAVEKILEVEDEIAGIAGELARRSREIASVIDQIENPGHHSVLSLRYLSFWPWDRIAAEMNYDARHVYRLHGRALREVALLLTGDGHQGEGPRGGGR